MAYYQKHRPESFEQVLGAKNQAACKSIQSLISGGDPPHAFLLRGPHGCGKTSIGRLIGGALGAVGEDFKEVDSADFRGIDSVREIRRGVAYRALRGDRRVWLIDEVHKMTNDAQNALLKALEDPPPHAYFILCTTEPEKILTTVRSRCVIYEVSRLSDDEMMRLIRRIAIAEGKQLTRSVFQAIVDGSRGHPRDGIQLLEQVAADPDAAADLIQGREISESRAMDLYNAMTRNQGWKSVRTILSDLRQAGEDAESMRRLLLACCANELLRAESDTSALIMDEMIEPFYDTGFPGLVFACYSAMKSLA